ncbi:hypothetical protein BH10PSE15_BH10PSE15_09210 [soil metagenome]
MSDLRSRIHLFDEKLTLSQELMARFDGWAMMSPSGQIAPSRLAELGIDSWMKPACTTFAQIIGPEPGGLTMAQVTKALQVSFDPVPSDFWDGIRDAVADAGEKLWPKYTIPGAGEPLELGSIRPDGTIKFNDTTDLIDGTKIDPVRWFSKIPPVHYRAYKIGGQSVDIFPTLYLSGDIKPINPLRGGGVAVEIGKIKFNANMGVGATKKMQGGVQLEISW